MCHENLRCCAAQDLANTGHRFARNPDGAGASYFKNAADPIALSINDRAVVVSSPEEGVQLLLDGTVDAYITETPVLTYYANRVRPTSCFSCRLNSL
jgi:ABC-type amino acid transport substrate-binding protein